MASYASPTRSYRARVAAARPATSAQRGAAPSPTPSDPVRPMRAKASGVASGTGAATPGVPMEADRAVNANPMATMVNRTMARPAASSGTVPNVGVQTGGGTPASATSYYQQPRSYGPQPGATHDTVDWARYGMPDVKPGGSPEAQQLRMAQYNDPLSELHLRDRWLGEMDADTGRQRAGAAQYWGTAGDASRRTQALEDWEPSESAGYDLSFLRDFDPTELRRATPRNLEGYAPSALEGFDSRESRNVDLSKLNTFDPTATRGVSTAGLRTFNGGDTIASYLERSGGAGGWNATASAGTASYDPMAAMKMFAEGASGISRAMLGDALTDQENAAARAGRLKTGLFDADKGSVIRRVGEDLNNQIATRALDAARIGADIEQGNARNRTDASIASARERGNMGATLAQLRSNEARDAAQLGLDALDRSTGYDVDLATELDRLTLDGADRAAGRGIDRAGNIDRNALTAAEATDRLRLDRADRLDTLGQDRARDIDDLRFRATDSYGRQEGDRRNFVDDSRYTGRRDAGDQTLRRLALDQDFYTGQIDRSGDRIASERDRITGQDNFNRALAQQGKQQRANQWGSYLDAGLTGLDLLMRMRGR